MSDTATTQKRPPVVPRWLVRTIWIVHRAAYRSPVAGSACGPSDRHAVGDASAQTVGRRSGRKRVAIVGYIEDGPNMVTRR